MKKLLIVLLFALAVPVMAAEVNGCIDLNYFMSTPNDTDADSANEPAKSEALFGEIGAAVWVTQELADGITGKVKLCMVDSSNGMDSLTGIGNHLGISLDIGIAHAADFMSCEDLGQNLRSSARNRSRICPVSNACKLNARIDLGFITQDPKSGSKPLGGVRRRVLSNENIFRIMSCGCEVVP